MRHGPRYYLMLGDVLKVFEQRAAAGAVERIGGKVVLDQSTNVFTPRNSLAHSRSISQAGLQCVRAVYAQLDNALTPDGLHRVLAEPDAGARPDDVLPQLID